MCQNIPYHWHEAGASAEKANAHSVEHPWKSGLATLTTSGGGSGAIRRGGCHGHVFALEPELDIYM